MMRGLQLRATGVALATAMLVGCVHAPLNQPLAKYDPQGGFRYTPRPPEAVPSDVAVLLFFSGGGKRASALSYGVLRELRDTVVGGPAGERRLLDDVEIISSVSGGSFTAAYYALHHEGIFEHYEQRYLKRNVDAALIRRALFPTAWPSLSSPYYGRSDLAADYYHAKVFRGATFRDLTAAGNRPMLLINATDMANGEQFAFTQIRFDLLGSDLSSYPVARAVAASSAAPFLLTPITLQNHAGAAGETQSIFLPREDAAIPRTEREREVRELMRSYTDSAERPFIHLVDGGLSDNLGLRALMDASLLSGGLGELAERLGMRPFNKLAVIIVNAATRRGGEWSKRESVPGILHSIQQLGDNIGAQVNHRSLEAFERQLSDWRAKARGARVQSGNFSPTEVPPDYYMITVTFEEVADPDDRAFFRNLATSFHLPENTVDRLTDAGARLLRESPEFQRLLRDLKSRK